MGPPLENPWGLAANQETLNRPHPHNSAYIPRGLRTWYWIPESLMTMGELSIETLEGEMEDLTRCETRENFTAIVRREKTKNYITRLYGEEIHRSIRRLEELRKEKARLLSDLAFLLRCRDSDTIPTFAKIKSSVKSSAVDRLLRRTGLALVRERIHYKRRALDTNAIKLKDIHLHLTTIL